MCEKRIALTSMKTKLNALERHGKGTAEKENCCQIRCG